jgi:hypothetical protein
MSRNDSSLYSGISSASFETTKQQELRAERAKARVEAKRGNQTAIAPAAELIKTELQKEVTTLIYGPYTDEDNMSDEQFRTERRARKLAVASLLAIQTRLNNLLRNEPRDK